MKKKRLNPYQTGKCQNGEKIGNERAVAASRIKTKIFNNNIQNSNLTHIVRTSTCGRKSLEMQSQLFSRVFWVPQQVISILECIDQRVH